MELSLFPTYWGDDWIPKSLEKVQGIGVLHLKRNQVVEFITLYKSTNYVLLSGFQVGPTPLILTCGDLSSFKILEGGDHFKTFS